MAFNLDWGTSDHADSFVNSHVFYKQNVTLLDDVFSEGIITREEVILFTAGQEIATAIIAQYKEYWKRIGTLVFLPSFQLASFFYYSNICILVTNITNRCDRKKQIAYLRRQLCYWFCF